MQTLDVIELGQLHIANPGVGDPAFLSAASGAVWSDRLYVVGDDQASLAEFALDQYAVLEALRTGQGKDLLRPGRALRIMPGQMPADKGALQEAKADFEALTLVRRRDIATIADRAIREECQWRFPHGLVLTAGSGGLTWAGKRRSLGVVYLRDEHGHIVGMPSPVSLEGLHVFLEDHVTGDLNIEGITVHNGKLILAQRGNSITSDGTPGENRLIRVSLAEALSSLYTDLVIGQCELEVSQPYGLGYRKLTHGDEEYDAKLDFTDIDSVAHDPHGRLVFTAAAEGPDGTPIRGQIAGSSVGIIGPDGNIQQMIHLADPTIKLEGIDARYNPALGSIDLLLVSDADNPEVPAPLFAARIPA